MRPTPNQGSHARRLLVGAIAAIALLTVWDYYQYHATLERAMSSVRAYDGTVGSLLDWPFGKELHIKFERPLDAAEVQELKSVNNLTSRHSVSIMFDCEITEEQLREARSAYPDCYVGQSKQRFN